MKTLSKLIIAILGAPFVVLLLAAAWIRRLISGPYCCSDDVILLYSQVTWDEVWQRPQQYAWRAAEEFTVLYSCPVQLHNLLFLGKKWRPVRHLQVDNRSLLVLSPLIFSGHFKNHFIHKLNCWITAKHLLLALGPNTRIHGLINTPYGLPVINHAFYPEGRRSPRLARLVYDVIDDFTVFDWSPPFGNSADVELMEKADAVIAGTHELADSRRNAVFIPCGVDYDLFAADHPVPVDIERLPRPIIGYFGTISERINLDIISALGKRFPSASIVMIGPVHLPVQMLPQAPNIHYLGLRRHAQLPAYAQAFDVALIPFRITNATLKLNPVKTLEYLAAGLPVVATRLPDLERFYDHVVHIADSPEEFVNTVESLLNEPSHGRVSTGVEIARTASWNSMVEKINEALFSGSNITPARGITGTNRL